MRYLGLLTMTFQSFLLPPYFENIGKRFIKSPKLFFSDVGLIKTVLGDSGVSPGALYENWVFTELGSSANRARIVLLSNQRRYGNRFPDRQRGFHAAD